MEALKRDTFFQNILQETQSTAIIRGVVTVVFGYWSNEDYHRKVSEAITGELKKIPKPDCGPRPLKMVYDDIPNIDVSFTVEGFKEALTTRYRNDPNRDYNHVREEIERNSIGLSGWSALISLA
ncbi:unnamed protein product [Cuscuta campestris]|uniref:Uncharacterized protein n=1 Tax=Cuscuta campestris TaxID=132261 RepID=A0A484KBI0_9ASTE|nr:unnamed protein product [Cuscuta campestris]